MYCEGDLDNFDKLSQEEYNLKDDHKFISPFISIKNRLKKGFVKIKVKLYRLNERLTQWEIKEQIKYEKEWKIYESSFKYRLNMKAFRNHEKYKNLYRGK